MKKRIFIIASAWMLSTGSIIAQTRNPGLDIMRTNIWRFGWVNFSTGVNPPGLDFSSGTPVVFNCGDKPVGQGATTISDSAGNMLLSGGYGGNCYECPRMFDRTCDTMANSGVVGDIGFIGSSRLNIAIPQPKSPNLIYYFSSAMTFNYLIVDMNLNGGLGAVIFRDTLEQGPTGVKLAAVHHCNGSDIWVVGHLWNTDTFFAYLLTDTGITLPPVYTKIGPVDFQPGKFQLGRMKFSSDGNKMAIVFNGDSIPPYLFDFDKSSGIISNPIVLQKDAGDEGIAFSPDNTKLYICTTQGKLLQYDMKASDSISIVQSRKLIAHVFQDLSAMQLGRDGKIYLSSGSQPYSYYLEVINNPNASDTLCGFQTGVIYLNGSTGLVHSLMNTVDSYFYSGSSAYPCYGDTNTIDIAKINETDLGIKVYPNPFSHYATIDIPNVLFTRGKIEYRLLDITGRECETQIKQQNYGVAQLYRGQLKPGIYLLVINLYGKTQTFKISIF